ncbi:MAG TPA: hypothetical protein IGR64_04860 [Leptolyngbyaceae cyanobacterium M65_K2018_010]|nr:hypothetical protein [Leptolyngbyaceae cyanobacterium M65_K2018_010]
MPRSLAHPQEAIEYLVLHQTAQDFRLEVEHRARLEAYYQWYDQIAQAHRQELARMQRELNLRAWFSRPHP